MIRRLAVIGVILAFVASTKDQAGYCVIITEVCPPGMSRAAVACDQSATESSDQQAAVQSGSCCAEPEKPACSKSKPACGDESKESCGKSPCPTSKDDSKCCLCVSPLWSELPAKPAIAHNHLTMPLLGDSSSESYYAYRISLDKFAIPPWGVHPTISTTVLRI